MSKKYHYRTNIYLQKQRANVKFADYEKTFKFITSQQSEQMKELIFSKRILIIVLNETMLVKNGIMR